MSQSPIRFSSNDDPENNSPIRLGGKPGVVGGEAAGPKGVSAPESAAPLPPAPQRATGRPAAHPSKQGVVSSEATAIAAEDSLASQVSTLDDMDF